MNHGSYIDCRIFMVFHQKELESVLQHYGLHLGHLDGIQRGKDKLILGIFLRKEGNPRKKNQKKDHRKRFK